MTISGNEFIYSLPANKTFKAGTAYTYNIAVKATGISVSCSESGEWHEGETMSVQMQQDISISVTTAEQLIDLAKLSANGLKISKITIENDIDFKDYYDDYDYQKERFPPFEDVFFSEFDGVFDGQGHTLKNLQILKYNDNNVGFVGTNKGTIKNLILENVQVNGSYQVGGIAGTNCDGGVVEHCNVVYAKIYGKVSGQGGRDVGGIAGCNQGIIRYCYTDNKTKVIGGRGLYEHYSGNQIGGIVGYNYYGHIVACYNQASVEGSDYVGGIVGYNRSPIAACYSAGSVRGNEYVGGIIGDGTNGESDVISCYHIMDDSTPGISVSYDEMIEPEMTAKLNEGIKMWYDKYAPDDTPTYLYQAKDNDYPILVEQQ